MENFTIGQAINENKGFFKADEVINEFKDYRRLENNKYIETNFEILKYEINEIKFKKILKNEEITKYNTTIGYISKYLSKEERKIYYFIFFVLLCFKFCLGTSPFHDIISSGSMLF